MIGKVQEVIFHETIIFSFRKWLLLSVYASDYLFCLLCENRAGPFNNFPMPAGTREAMLVSGAEETLQEKEFCFLMPRALLVGSCSAVACPVPGYCSACDSSCIGSCTADSFSSASHHSAVTPSVPSSALWVISQAPGSCSIATSPVASTCRVLSFSSTQLLRSG